MGKKTNPLERVTPKLTAYGIKVSLSPQDIVAIRKDPSIRLTATPFIDNFEEIRIPGESVKWKGLKKEKGEELDDFLARLEKVNPDVAAGLKKAIKISKECAEVTGVRRVGRRFLPNKVICQIEKAGKAETEATPA